jgi:hypothetical protein
MSATIEKRERSYAKKKHKTEPVGIRFNILQVAIALSKSKKDTKQELVDWLIERYVNGENPVQERQPIQKSISTPPLQVPKMSQYEAYAIEIRDIKDNNELRITCEGINADKELQPNEKQRLFQFATHIAKEKGFYQD